MWNQNHQNVMEAYAAKFGLPAIEPSGDAAREWTFKLGQQFNFSFANEGWGTKRASPTRPPSTDVICTKSPFVGYDTIVSQGAPEQKLNNLVGSSGESLDGQVFIETPPVNYIGSDPPAHSTMLQFTLMWAWRGMLERFDQLDHNINLGLSAKMKSIRWFFTVGDDGRVGSDPWSGSGAQYNHPKHYSNCVDLMRYLQSKQILSHMVLCGGLKPDGTCGSMYDTPEKRDAIVDRAAILINNFPNDFVVVEIWNEYIVNGADRAWLRHMARRLRGQIPSHIRITLSSPNSVMGGNASETDVRHEIESMYGADSGANTFTMHSTRPNHLPWNPETIRHLVGIEIIDGEPRGPGASGAPRKAWLDPSICGGDFKTAIRGRAIVYDFHHEPGVWGGKCDERWNDNNTWPNFDSIPTWPQLRDTLKAIAEGGTIPEPGEPVIPYNENLSVDFGLACNDVYGPPNNIPQDPGMISVHSSRAAWDYYVGGLAWEESKIKHINELRAVYGLPPV